MVSYSVDWQKNVHEVSYQVHVYDLIYSILIDFLYQSFLSLLKYVHYQQSSLNPLHIIY